MKSNTSVKVSSVVGLRRSGLTMASILVVYLAGAPASVAAEADAGVTVSVAEAAFVLY